MRAARPRPGVECGKASWDRFERRRSRPKPGASKVESADRRSRSATGPKSGGGAERDEHEYDQLEAPLHRRFDPLCRPHQHVCFSVVVTTRPYVVVAISFVFSVATAVASYSVTIAVAIRHCRCRRRCRHPRSGTVSATAAQIRCDAAAIAVSIAAAACRCSDAPPPPPPEPKSGAAATPPPTPEAVESETLATATVSTLEASPALSLSLSFETSTSPEAVSMAACLTFAERQAARHFLDVEFDLADGRRDHDIVGRLCPASLACSS